MNRCTLRNRAFMQMASAQQAAAKEDRVTRCEYGEDKAVDKKARPRNQTIHQLGLGRFRFAMAVLLG